MNIKRLKLLIEALEKEQENEKIKSFDMEVWATLDESVKLDTLDKCDNEVFNDLVTNSPYFSNEDDCLIIPLVACASACALGTAALYEPLFQQGLTLVTNSRLQKYPISNMHSCTVYFEGETETNAGAKFFGISLSQALHLFDPETYESFDITPEMVIKRIKEIIANPNEVPERCHT